MTRLTSQLSAVALATLLGATAVLQACGPDDSQDDGDSERLGTHALALSGTNARLEIHQQQLDRFAAAVKADHDGSACRWKVSAPTFHITPAGVRLKGVVAASCLSYTRSPLPGAVVRPLAGKAVSWSTSSGSSWMWVGSNSFDLPATVTYRDGYLRLDVSDQPVSVVHRYTGQRLFRIDLSPYFSTSLYVAKSLIDTERTTFEAAADNVSWSLLDQRIRVTSRVAIH